MHKTLISCVFWQCSIYVKQCINQLLLHEHLTLSNSAIFRTMDNKKEVEDEKKDSSSSVEEQESSSSSLDQAEGGDSDTSMDKIRKFLEQKLHIFDNNSSDHVEKVLTETTVDGVVEFIKTHNVKKIVTMAGAGISTSAGIPDFRSPKSGLYHNLDKYNLPHPQAIFELDFFKSNPEPFFVLAKELLPEGYKPTPSHYFIRLLHEKGLLLRHYTQNIDTLERLAGLPEEKLVEAHGTFHSGRCLDCQASFDLPWMKEKIKKATVPKCEECSEGVVKPDIVFFGEMLPDRFHRLIDQDFPEAELLIIMGSSLLVQPFASLVDRVKRSCPRLLINKEKVGMQDRLSRFLGISSGMNFDSSNGRDVALLGECDKGCQLLAEKLGWGDELKDLIAKEYERLDTETAELKEYLEKEKRPPGNEKLTLLEALAQNNVTKKH
ncbi:NAD-dependent protein deacetylase sirtuin-2 [Nasonia vitripennis]|uniref:Deacetylase sirtuin-type domain-containing protein n=1 Tax=Nasonia vitripennis TaxID=7425 RepID=A0A7M7J8K6_NASVI|nr:NAD-dependent protein deacetylase sirtuin-2 [Nasonia vitripennis]